MELHTGRKMLSARTTMTNKFAEALNSGRMIVTAEYLPPRGSDAAAVQSAASALPANLDAIVVADNPDKIRASAFSAAILLSRKSKAAVILSMATRDRNRIALMSDALGAAALNVDAILCMSGNHQSLGICTQAAAANDIDSVQFTQAMKKLVLYGSGLNGRELESKLDLQIGATAHPYMRPMDLNLLRLKKKITVGADFLMTQAVFDLEGFEEWLDAVRATGLDKRTAIIASVLPLASVEQAEELQQSQTYGPVGDAIIARIRKAPDAAEEGVAIAAEKAKQLKEMPGVRGIHILCGGYEALAADLMEQAGLYCNTPERPQFSQASSTLSL
jgi:methylenetetrahydrofolate reductase (NADPH)